MRRVASDRRKSFQRMVLWNAVELEALGLEVVAIVCIGR